jgi:alpha-tubulin suppressor-like RCC1 family protein
VLALESSGSVLAWGKNTSGELGTETPALASPPVQVPSLTGVSQVSAGRAFSLAVYLPAQYR